MKRVLEDMREYENEEKHLKQKMKKFQNPEFLVPVSKQDSDWTRSGAVLTCAVCRGTASKHNSLQGIDPHPWRDGKVRSNLLPSQLGPHIDGQSLIN